MMSTDESCPTSHRVYKLSIKKNKGRKRRNFVVNKDNLAKELGPGKKDWLEDATARKLLKKKLEDKQTPTTKGHLPLPCLSPIESSPSCSIPSTFQHLLSSQKSSPNSPLAWEHLSLGESPDLDDTCNKQSRAVPTQSGIVKSLGLDLNDSALSWTESLATPTAHSPAAISAVENSLSPVSKQKGLPRVLFSPGPALTDDELGHTLDFTSEDNTDEESEPGDKCYNNVKPVCIKAEQTFDTSHVKSRNSEVVCESNNEELYSFERSQDIQPVLNVQNVKEESKDETTTQDLFSMSLFSQDENFTQEVVSETEKPNQNTSTDDKATDDKELGVNVALSDFFDPPSSAVGKRRCAPSRGKKRKSEDEEHLMLELFMDSDNASGKKKKTKCLNKSNRTSPGSLSNRSPNGNKESLQGLLNASVQDTKECHNCSKEIKLPDSTANQSNPDKSISNSVSVENQYIIDTSTPVHQGKKVIPDLLFKHIERGESWTDGESFNSTPVNAKKVLKSILSSEKKGRSSGKKKQVRFVLETKSSLKRNCRKLSETEQTFDDEWMNVVCFTDQEDSLLLGTKDSYRDVHERQDKCNMESEQDVKPGEGKQYECGIKYEQNLKLCDGKPYECDMQSEQDMKPCDSEELKSKVKSTLETSDDMFSQVSPTALRDMCEAASSEISTGTEKVDVSKPTNYPSDGSKVSSNDSVTSSGEKQTLRFENSFVKAQGSNQREDEVQGRTASSTKPLSGKLRSLGSNAKRFLYPTTKQISTSCPKTVFAFAEQTKSIQKITDNTELAGITKDAETSLDVETVGKCQISKKQDSVTGIDENYKLVPTELLGFERFSSMKGGSTEDQERKNLVSIREGKGNSNIDKGVDISLSSASANRTGLNPEEEMALCETSTETITTGVTAKYIDISDHRADKSQISEGWPSKNETTGISESQESTLTKAADGHIKEFKHTDSLLEDSPQKDEGKACLKESLTLEFMSENICSIGFTKASGGKVDISAQALEIGSKMMIDASKEKTKNFVNIETNCSCQDNVNEMLVHSKVELEKITTFHSVASIGDGNHQTLKSNDKDFDTSMDGTGEKCSKLERCEEDRTSNVRNPCQSYAENNEHSVIAGSNTAADAPVQVSDNGLVKAGQLLSNEHAKVDLDLDDENSCQEMEFSNSTNEIENVETKMCISKSDVANDHYNNSAKETNHIGNTGTLTCSSGEISMTEKDVLNLSKLEKKCIVVQKQFSGFSTAGGKLIQPSDSSITKAADLMADVNSFEAEVPYSADSISSTNKNKKMRKDNVFEAANYGENLKKIQKSFDELIQSNGSSLRKTADSVRNSDTPTGDRNVENYNVNVITSNTLACESDTDIRNESKNFGGFNTARGQDVILSMESIKKANSVMAECGGSVDQRECIENAGNIQNNALDLFQSSTCHDIAEQLGKDSMCNDWSKLPEFGFQTAGGKNVSCKVESLSKAKKLISETSELFDEMEVANYNNTENMFNGVAKNILEKSCVQNVSPSCSAVKCSNVMTGFSTAGGKHVKLSEESLGKAKTLVEESQEHVSEELPPLAGFEEMLKKASSQNRGHKVANQGGYPVSNENIFKAKDLFSDINSFNIPLKNSHVGTGANQFKPVVQSCASSNKKQINTMKSSFTSSRFPPGANIPKGFRPFKPPKLRKPVLRHEEKQAELSSEHQDVCESGDLKQKPMLPKYSPESNDLKEPVSAREISAGLEHTDIDKNCKDISDQELDGYLMDDLFCEELEPSQKFSPDSGKVIGISQRKYIKKQIETKNITFSDLVTGKRNNCKADCYPKIQNIDVKCYKQELSPNKTSDARGTSNTENSMTFEMETSAENDKIPKSTSKSAQSDKFDKSNSEIITNKSIFDVNALTQFDDDDPLLQLAMMEDLDDSAYMDVSQESPDKSGTKKKSPTGVTQLPEGCKSGSIVDENKGDGNDLNNTRNFLFEETVVTGSADVMFQGFKSASGKLVKLSNTALLNARKCLTDCSNEDDELNLNKNLSFKVTQAVGPSKCMSSDFKDHTVSKDLSICISSSTRDSGIVSADNITITQEFDSTHTSKTNFDMSDYHSLDGMKQDTEVESESVVNVNHLKAALGNDVGISSEALDETRNNLESVSGTNSGPVSSVKYESLPLGVMGVKDSVETTSVESGDKIMIGEGKRLMENSLLQDNTHFALEELINSQVEFTQVESVENVCHSTSSRNILSSCCNTEDKERSFNSEHNRRIAITCPQNSKKLLTDDSIGPVSPLQRFSSFQSASGKSVSVSEKALQHARNTMENVTVDVSPFQSGSGKPVSVSEKALQQARNTMENATMDVSPFQSASGKPVSVSEKALQQARNTMENVTIDVSPFQSASGKPVIVSEKALQQARNTMENATMDVSSFQSASGKPVSVSEKALQQARNTMENVTMDVSPFQSASGKPVIVSEKALQQERNAMENVTMDFSPFQSASGKPVIVSEKALQQARNTMENVTMDVSPFHSASGKPVIVSEKALQQARNTMENATMDVSSFQSASGKPVIVSEKALQQARNTMENATMDVSPFQSASGKPVSVSEKALQQARNTMENVTMDVSPFQIASRKPVIVSEKALQQERNAMENVTMDVSPFQSASGKPVIVSEKALQQARNTKENVTMDVSPFQSASGKPVSVSEKAMQQVRNTMENVTIDVSPFQSASGISVSVSEKALQQARNTMENVTMDVSPFQTASGNSVSVSEKALQQARNTVENSTTNVSHIQSNSGKFVSISKQPIVQVRKSEISLVHDVLVERSIKPRNDKNNMDVVTPNFSAFYQKTDLQHKILETISNRMDIEKDLNESFGNQGKRHTDRPLTKQLNNRGTLQTDQPIVRLHNQGEEVFYQPEDFLEEMEIPPKRRKLNSASEKDNDGKNSKLEMFVPLKTTPEAVIKDRTVSSHNLKPLYSYSSGHSSREKAQYCNVDSQQINLAQQPVKAVFKTPYKTSGVQRQTESAGQKTTKSQTPVYLPKAVAKNKTFLNKKVPLAAHEISNIEKDSANAVNRCTRNDIDKVRESRKFQDDIIQKKEKTRIKPADGRLYLLKNQKHRPTLKGVFELCNKSPSELELLKQGVQRSTLSVRSGNASQHYFHLPDFYNGFEGHVYVGDGAFLVPDDQLNAGKKEFYRAFLTVEGVDKKLISEAWFYNHYRWVVWKLASYEVVSPGNFAGRSLNPEVVMLQMKYRYDREIDKCQRSALKKIMERDDTASKRMVLCVSDVCQSQPSTSIATPTNTRKEESSINRLDVQTCVELTDGWYSVQAKLDVPLQDLVNNSKIRVGDKLCTSGAELVGSQEACSPLEAPPDLFLKLNANSTRPVGWDTRLGFQKDLRPLCVPLTGLYGEGGTVGCLDVVVARKFPVMYMEKYQDGSCVFRSRQAEDKCEHQHEQQRQIEMEKLYSRLQKKYEQDEIAEKCVTKKKWTKAEVEHLQTGQELYEACNSCRQSEILEEYLSEDQMSMLVDYRRCVQEQKRQKLHAEFQKEWQSTSERNVVPLMKMRIVGCSRKDLDTKASAMISVWRPTPEILDLKEGGRYKMFGLSASSARSHYNQHNVQLTANRQTRFHTLEVDENLLDLLYEPREVMSVTDIRCRKGLFGEVDFVGIVLSVSSVDFAENGRHQDIVYVADTSGGILGIKFWGGIKNHSIEDLIKKGCIICAMNLLDKSNYRGSSLPMLECSSEFTSLTTKPQNSSQRQAVEKLQIAIKDKDFMENARQHLTELKQKLIKHTPEKLKEIPGSHMARSTSPNNIPVSSAVTPGGDTAVKRSVYQAKMARLLNYGSPSPLSPLSAVSSRRVSKAFKSPLVQNRAGQS